MGISDIQFYNFRNIQNSKLDITGKNIFLIGNNGQGKTNLLEALYLTAYGSSFRPKKEQDFIRFNEKECSIRITYGRDEDQVHFQIQNKKKSILVNGTRISDRKTLLQFFPVIIFNHDDISLISGTPEKRRKFIDQAVAHCTVGHIEEMRSYKKILQQRNMVLKTGDDSLLDILDQQLVECGVKLMHNRASIIRLFDEKFQSLFNSISHDDSDLSIVYKPSWKSAEPIAELRSGRERDLLYKTTTSGPHRDHFIVYRNGKDFSKTASTGQKRLLALILKLRQSELISERSGKKPILLFDDVLLELDGSKRKRVLDYLPVYEQAFFTFLPEEPYMDYAFDSKRCYIVKEGRIEEDEKDR